MSEATAMKQLKKNDFLNAVSTEPMTRGDLVDALEDFDFIPSYLDYLTDHFVAQGKIIKNEDDTFQRKAPKAKGGASRDLFRVVEAEVDGEDTYEIEKKTLGQGEYYNDACKEEGWRQTPSAAAKAARQAIFAQYKADTAEVNAVLASFEEAGETEGDTGE